MDMESRASHPRVLLFDWLAGGHHEAYLQLAAEVLRPVASVWIAAPAVSRSQLSEACEGYISLGSLKPAVENKTGLARLAADRQEVRLLRSASRRAGASHVVHLFADALLPALALGPRFDKRVTTLLFRPRSHYPETLGSSLEPKERMEAFLYELAVRLWRQRRDSHVLLSLDETAVALWERQPGAPARWLPEPPVPSVRPPPNGERSGCILFGRLGARKGVSELARAIALSPTDLRITLAGEVDAAYRPQLKRDIAEMEHVGAEVIVVDERLSEREGMELMAVAQFALLPYPRHFGGSRVLVNAAAVGTPCVASAFGLLGHHVRRWGTGITVDPKDPVALRYAMDQLRQEPAGARATNLATFAQRYSDEAFSSALMSVLDTRVEGRHDAGGAGESLPPEI